MKYCKPPLSISGQIKLLQSRGMIISNNAETEALLASLNYYRLSAYWLPFEISCSGETRTHMFRSGTTFNQCQSLYNFDAHLRQICFAGIKKLELALRSQFAYQLSILYGSHCYLDSKSFQTAKLSSSGKTLWSFNNAIKEIEKTVNSSHEVFIKHYLKTYTDPAGKPPIWMVVELLSMGDLSRWFKNLKQPKDRQCIADLFNIDESVLVTAIHHFSVIL